MSNRCPECGGELPGGKDQPEGQTCQEIFEGFLVHDYTDPGYGVVHFLTVACFMVQHGRYSDEGLAWIVGRMRQFLEDGVSQEQIRREVTSEVDQGFRRWKVTRRPGDPPAAKVAWSLTIGEVKQHAVDAESYREWVRKWGEATVRELSG